MKRSNQYFDNLSKSCMAYVKISYRFSEFVGFIFGSNTSIGKIITNNRAERNCSSLGCSSMKKVRRKRGLLSSSCIKYIHHTATESH